MATPNLVPRADSEGGIGTASKYWASAYIDLIYVGAGKIGRDADNLLDFSTDNFLQIRVNANTALGVESGALFPIANDGMGGGGWFRCSITFKATAGSDNASTEENTPGTINAFSISAAGSTAANVAVGGTILMYTWGWQLETDIETTPYIPTTSSFARVTTTLNDTSDVWDFDGADLMPEADPDDEGVWELNGDGDLIPKDV